MGFTLIVSTISYKFFIYKMISFEKEYHCLQQQISTVETHFWSEVADEKDEIHFTLLSKMNISKSKITVLC